MTSERQSPGGSASDPAAFVRTRVELATQSQRLFADYLSEQVAAASRGEAPERDPLNVAPAFAETASS
ncbi:MAG: hypothetical protein FJZ92_14195 [Chloroflexi bacterium]|nr:hypothetical protein [Chloroflexota bacterium]